MAAFCRMCCGSWWPRRKLGVSAAHRAALRLPRRVAYGGTGRKGRQGRAVGSRGEAAWRLVEPGASVWLVAVAGILPVGLVEFDFGGGGAAEAEVEHFDEDGKGHGEVDVAFGDVLVEAFGDEHGAD